MSFKTQILSIASLSLVFSASSFSDTFTLRNNDTGRSYVCSNGTGGGPGPIDIKCLQDLTEYIFRNSMNSRTDSIPLAQRACRIGYTLENFSANVDFCFKNTMNSRSACIEVVLNGGFSPGSEGLAAMKSLVDSAKEAQVLESAGVNVKAQKALVDSVKTEKK